MNLQTFPMTAQALHSTGVNLVRCHAIGYVGLYLTDDFGNFIELSDVVVAQYSIGSGAEH